MAQAADPSNVDRGMATLPTMSGPDDESSEFPWPAPHGVELDYGSRARAAGSVWRGRGCCASENNCASPSRRPRTSKGRHGTWPRRCKLLVRECGSCRAPSRRCCGSWAIRRGCWFPRACSRGSMTCSGRPCLSTSWLTGGGAITGCAGWSWRCWASTGGARWCGGRGGRCKRPRKNAVMPGCCG